MLREWQPFGQCNCNGIHHGLHHTLWLDRVVLDVEQQMAVKEVVPEFEVWGFHLLIKKGSNEKNNEFDDNSEGEGPIQQDYGVVFGVGAQQQENDFSSNVLPTRMYFDTFLTNP
jgi:hypothetical protein